MTKKPITMITVWQVGTCRDANDYETKFEEEGIILFTHNPTEVVALMGQHHLYAMERYWVKTWPMSVEQYLHLNRSNLSKEECQEIAEEHEVEWTEEID